MFAPVAVAGGLTVDAVPRAGIYLASDDDPLPPGAYGLPTLVPRVINLMLAACQATHVDSLNGATIVRIPTGYASSFDRHMPVATRERLYEDGYKLTRRVISILD
ncbi:hypothetical protein LGN07_23975 [Burkholderia cepacia]|uniref:hypothetical protein n=1 Tax=Burkholderia cepacia TaxID=292 RepID=UPI001CF2F159|nr:hypothetical protein [Burkholderia cepacia]MCA8121791.1 hypothetical protein [Burkholderia cepacia]